MKKKIIINFAVVIALTAAGLFNYFYFIKPVQAATGDSQYIMTYKTFYTKKSSEGWEAPASAGDGEARFHRSYKVPMAYKVEIKNGAGGLVAIEYWLPAQEGDANDSGENDTHHDGGFQITPATAGISGHGAKSPSVKFTGHARLVSLKAGGQDVVDDHYVETNTITDDFINTLTLQYEAQSVLWDDPGTVCPGYFWLNDDMNVNWPSNACFTNAYTNTIKNVVYHKIIDNVYNKAGSYAFSESDNAGLDFELRPNRWIVRTQAP